MAESKDIKGALPPGAQKLAIAKPPQPYPFWLGGDRDLVYVHDENGFTDDVDVGYVL